MKISGKNQYNYEIYPQTGVSAGFSTEEMNDFRMRVLTNSGNNVIDNTNYYYQDFIFQSGKVFAGSSWYNGEINPNYNFVATYSKGAPFAFEFRYNTGRFGFYANDKIKIDQYQIRSSGVQVNSIIEGVEYPPLVTGFHFSGLMKDDSISMNAQVLIHGHNPVVNFSDLTPHKVDNKEVTNVLSGTIKINGFSARLNSLQSNEVNEHQWPPPNTFTNSFSQLNYYLVTGRQSSNENNDTLKRFEDGDLVSIDFNFPFGLVRTGLLVKREPPPDNPYRQDALETYNYSSAQKQYRDFENYNYQDYQVGSMFVKDTVDLFEFDSSLQFLKRSGEVNIYGVDKMTGILTGYLRGSGFVYGTGTGIFHTGYFDKGGITNIISNYNTQYTGFMSGYKYATGIINKYIDLYSEKFENMDYRAYDDKRLDKNWDTWKNYHAVTGFSKLQLQGTVNEGSGHYHFVGNHSQPPSFWSGYLPVGAQTLPELQEAGIYYLEQLSGLKENNVSISGVYAFTHDLYYVFDNRTHKPDNNVDIRSFSVNGDEVTLNYDHTKNWFFLVGSTIDLIVFGSDLQGGNHVVVSRDASSVTFKKPSTQPGGPGVPRTKPITSATRLDLTVTITTSGEHGFVVGDRVTIAGITPSGYNGTFIVATVTANTFTYTVDVSPATSATIAPGAIASKTFGKIRDTTNDVCVYYGNSDGAYNEQLAGIDRVFNAYGTNEFHFSYLGENNENKVEKINNEYVPLLVRNNVYLAEYDIKKGRESVDGIEADIIQENHPVLCVRPYGVGNWDSKKSIPLLQFTGAKFYRNENTQLWTTIFDSYTSAKDYNDLNGPAVPMNVFDQQVDGGKPIRFKGATNYSNENLFYKRGLDVLRKLNSDFKKNDNKFFLLSGSKDATQKYKIKISSGLKSYSSIPHNKDEIHKISENTYFKNQIFNVDFPPHKYDYVLNHHTPPDGGRNGNIWILIGRDEEAFDSKGELPTPPRNPVIPYNLVSNKTIYGGYFLPKNPPWNGNGLPTDIEKSAWITSAFEPFFEHYDIVDISNPGGGNYSSYASEVRGEAHLDYNFYRSDPEFITYIESNEIKNQGDNISTILPGGVSYDEKVPVDMYFTGLVTGISEFKTGYRYSSLDFSSNYWPNILSNAPELVKNTVGIPSITGFDLRSGDPQKLTGLYDFVNNNFFSYSGSQTHWNNITRDYLYKSDAMQQDLITLSKGFRVSHEGGTAGSYDYYVFNFSGEKNNHITGNFIGRYGSGLFNSQKLQDFFFEIPSLTVYTDPQSVRNLFTLMLYDDDPNKNPGSNLITKSKGDHNWNVYTQNEITRTDIPETMEWEDVQKAAQVRYIEFNYAYDENVLKSGTFLNPEIHSQIVLPKQEVYLSHKTIGLSSFTRVPILFKDMMSIDNIAVRRALMQDIFTNIPAFSSSTNYSLHEQAGGTPILSIKGYSSYYDFAIQEKLINFDIPQFTTVGSLAGEVAKIYHDGGIEIEKTELSSDSSVITVTTKSPHGFSNQTKPITGATHSNSIVTITASGEHGFVVGDRVTIAGITPSGYNGTFTVATVTANTFTYTVAGNPATLETIAPGAIAKRNDFILIEGTDKSGYSNVINAPTANTFTYHNSTDLIDDSLHTERIVTRKINIGSIIQIKSSLPIISAEGVEYREVIGSTNPFVTDPLSFMPLGEFKKGDLVEMGIDDAGIFPTYSNVYLSGIGKGYDGYHAFTKISDTKFTFIATEDRIKYSPSPEKARIKLLPSVSYVTTHNIRGGLKQTSAVLGFVLDNHITVDIPSHQEKIATEKTASKIKISKNGFIYSVISANKTNDIVSLTLSSGPKIITGSMISVTGFGGSDYNGTYEATNAGDSSVITYSKNSTMEIGDFLNVKVTLLLEQSFDLASSAVIGPKKDPVLNGLNFKFKYPDIKNLVNSLNNIAISDAENRPVRAERLDLDYRKGDIGSHLAAYYDSQLPDTVRNSFIPEKLYLSAYSDDPGLYIRGMPTPGYEISESNGFIISANIAEESYFTIAHRHRQVPFAIGSGIVISGIKRKGDSIQLMGINGPRTVTSSTHTSVTYRLYAGQGGVPLGGYTSGTIAGNYNSTHLIKTPAKFSSYIGSTVTLYHDPEESAFPRGFPIVVTGIGQGCDGTYEVTASTINSVSYSKAGISPPPENKKTGTGSISLDIFDVKDDATVVLKKDFPLTGEVIEVNGYAHSKRVVIGSAARSDLTVTITTSGDHGFVEGEEIIVAGITPSDYNGTFIVATVAANTFTYTVAGYPALPTIAPGAIAATRSVLLDIGQKIQITHLQTTVDNYASYAKATISSPISASILNILDLEVSIFGPQIGAISRYVGDFKLNNIINNGSNTVITYLLPQFNAHSINRDAGDNPFLVKFNEDVPFIPNDTVNIFIKNFHLGDFKVHEVHPKGADGLSSIRLSLLATDTDSSFDSLGLQDDADSFYSQNIVVRYAGDDRLLVSGYKLNSKKAISLDTKIKVNNGIFFTENPHERKTTYLSDKILPLESQKTITSATHSSSIVTITTSGEHGFVVGDRVTIAGITPSGYNGTFIVATVTANTFTYTVDVSPATSATIAPGATANGYLSILPTSSYRFVEVYGFLSPFMSQDYVDYDLKRNGYKAVFAKKHFSDPIPEDTLNKDIIILGGITQ